MKKCKYWRRKAKQEEEMKSKLTKLKKDIEEKDKVIEDTPERKPKDTPGKTDAVNTV